MYDNLGAQSGMPRPPVNPQASPFGNAFSGGSSGFIRSGLGAYGEKILGSSSEYVQSNVSCFMDWSYFYILLLSKEFFAIDRSRTFWFLKIHYDLRSGRKLYFSLLYFCIVVFR